MDDFLFHGSLEELDSKIYELTQLENERQYRRLILIPSESTAPIAVREALSSSFQNIYAEGYPPEKTRRMSENSILDYSTRLADYRRFSDPRYYKGVEYADIIEALARRRCAELFAANGVAAKQIYVNVQALSGAPANNAVYHALVKPGETVMGMNLLHGGHLSHGSPVNRSGKYFNIVHYTVDPETERIDYEVMAELAKKHRPRMIIGGFSSYPWAADWEAMREIADSVDAYLMADIAHVAGLVAAGVYPSPMGHAHVITSTTHKTLNGPRGAIIMTTSKKLSEEIDRAVFPGEQGGPHVNVFAGLALAFKIAKTTEFKALQTQVIQNSVALTAQLEKRGLRIAFGGTNTHLSNVDTKSIKGPTGTTLSGDMAARILDIAGIVVNRNTIPGDRSALNPSGIRLGTPWITQRGFKEAESIALADIIADVLEACVPFRERSESRLSQRARIDFETLAQAKLKVRDLAVSAGIDFEPASTGYPHFYYVDDQPENKGEWVGLEISGKEASALLDMLVSIEIDRIQSEQAIDCWLAMPDDDDLAATIQLVNKGTYLLGIPGKNYGIVAEWLRSLSDGYVMIDNEDLARTAPGPVIVNESNIAVAGPESSAKGSLKAFYLGQQKEKSDPLPLFNFESDDNATLKRTPIFDEHVGLGAKMVPFAGWEMPVRYSSVREEHLAVRERAGLFDVTHMGVYDASGAAASSFLQAVCANDISAIRVGQSQYTHFLDTGGQVLDDLIVYRVESERYLIVVNASNDDRNWKWLTAVRDGEVQIDTEVPGGLVSGRTVQLRNLRASESGKDQLLDLALQGPASKKILRRLIDKQFRRRFLRLRRYRLMKAKLKGVDVVISRTGYTGETFSYEIFVHPDETVKVWQMLLEAGDKEGILPCGLAARDSLRIEAGLPLYGQELAGPLSMSPADAGFRGSIKSYKPWFIGRDAFMAKEAKRKREIVRFRFPKKGTRPAHQGDPVVNEKGKTIGEVSSCSLDKYGTLTGQAYINKRLGKKGSKIFVYQGQAKNKTGEWTGEASEAIVLSRFPE